MPASHLRKAQAQIDRIVEAGLSPGNRRSDPLLEAYIRQFYLHAPYEMLAGAKPTFLYHAAAGSWNFILERSKDMPRKARVFNPTVEEHGWQSPRTIVELSMEDCPFLLDSVTAEITRHRYKIYEVLHPILKITRNASGRISTLHDRDADLPEGGRMESSMHFQISHIADETERDALERDIGNALFFVTLAVGDWHPIEARVRGIIRELGEKALPFKLPAIEETRQFLAWLLEQNFVFLGVRDYDFVDEKGGEKLHYDPKCDLGIFRAGQESGHVHEAQPQGILEVPEHSSAARGKEKILLEITKSSRKSVVHRPVPMDYIGVKKYNEDGEIVGEYRLLGLFTSSVYYQSATRIPIIRRKIEAVIRRSGFPADSHNGKALLAVLETYPRDELLQSTEEDLFHIGMGIVSLGERPQARLFVRRDRFSRFVSCLVFVPRDRFNTQLREKMQAILEKAFGGEMTEYYTQVSESALARIHYFIRFQGEALPEPDLAHVEEQLEEASIGWAKGLRDTLVQVHEERAGEQLFLRYVDAFPEAFRNTYHFGGTVRDIFKIEEAYHRNDLSLDLYQHANEEEQDFHLKLYHPASQVALSEVLPILENMGFRGIDERTYFITPSHQKQGVWVHHFRLRLQCDSGQGNGVKLASFAGVKPEFEEALFNIWHRNIEDDGFNKLILNAHLKWRDAMMLRAFSRYAVQTSYPYSHMFNAAVIARYPAVAGLLAELFQARFSPALKEKEREERQNVAVASIAQLLATVKNIAEDRVIRQFQDTILATLRTNFFQVIEGGAHKPYLSFKLDSGKVPNLPLPKPYAEIFVYAPEVEGVHLRGGKVARGGLRWSDRLEDFRTEVLGLVKAQMVKNAVIVPVGSKGGFVVKRPVEGGREAVLEQGKAAYRTFLRGLLDLTDNIVKGDVTPPARVVRHDGDDPYLVVAADKGTASFSDIANGIAREYGFWLDDAFASGGSAGYDHKEMAITARGAWISVERHFAELQVDIAREDFTVVGIGDMSGDVFGNGMLLSKHIALLAAFNHQHIFLDPNPDAAASFKERTRMFALPRSSWEDYNPKLISEGGGVFARSLKSIPLSKQVRERFGITKDKLSPDELIRVLLLAPVDLLWNGGIGTYAKAASERNEEVGDRANDALRVNGGELRCRVIGEGGNLGFTQRGRIEYAQTGGKINTDAIDNSAGVDCSDHEVNIKIALKSAMEKGKLPLEQRNTLLAEMTDDVAALVLRDNFLQTQVITIAEQRGYMILESNTRLMRMLEEKKLLDRAIEYLPTDEELAERQVQHRGLTRPELAVTLAYSKIYAYDNLIQTNLPDDAHFLSDLLLYFPAALRERFREEIEQHPLRREIVATSVANSIVNRMGCTFFYRLTEDTGMKGCDVARAYTIVRDAFRLRELWAGIESAEAKIPANVQTRLFLDIRRMTERAISWFLRNSPHPLDTGALVAAFAPGIAELERELDAILPPGMKEARDARLAQYVKAGAPKTLAAKIVNLDTLASACDIVHVAGGSKLPIRTLGEVYYRLGTRLRLDWLREQAMMLWSHSYWDNLSVQTMLEALFDHQMRLTAEVTRAGNKKADAMEAWEKENTKALERYDSFLNDLAKQEKISLPMLTVALQRAGGLVR